mmetsp:Transcript_29467/g.71171  ORF Transcript_29467/g.71171 Transcript_29467/m.71171 type:complete len:218 (-) Transcript_29467:16-669(-)
MPSRLAFAPPSHATLGRSSLCAQAPSSFICSRLKSQSLAVGIRAFPSHFVHAPLRAQVVRPTLLHLRCYYSAAVVLSHLHGRSTECPAEETWRLLIRSDVTAPWLARRHPSTPWPAPVRLAEAHAIHSPDLGRYPARIPSSAASKEQAKPSILIDVRSSATPAPPRNPAHLPPFQSEPRSTPVTGWVCINCFDAANVPRRRYERQSWLIPRPHGQQR